MVVTGMRIVCVKMKYCTVTGPSTPFSPILPPNHQRIEIADRVKNFAVLYVCDLDQVPDFKQMYELYDPVTLMFFFRNKHMVGIPCSCSM